MLGRAEVEEIKEAKEVKEVKELKETLDALSVAAKPEFLGACESWK
jgi:hypothetical protein